MKLLIKDWFNITEEDLNDIKQNPNKLNNPKLSEVELKDFHDGLDYLD